MQNEPALRSVAWLVDAIKRLLADPPFPNCTPGRNRYNTRKDHWLGWSNPAVGKGSYLRRVREALSAAGRSSGAPVSVAVGFPRRFAPRRPLNGILREL